MNDLEFLGPEVGSGDCGWWKILGSRFRCVLQPSCSSCVTGIKRFCCKLQRNFCFTASFLLGDLHVLTSQVSSKYSQNFVSHSAYRQRHTNKHTHTHTHTQSRNIVDWNKVVMNKLLVLYKMHNHVVHRLCHLRKDCSIIEASQPQLSFNLQHVVLSQLQFYYPNDF